VLVVEVLLALLQNTNGALRRNVRDVPEDPHAVLEVETQLSVKRSMMWCRSSPWIRASRFDMVLKMLTGYKKGKYLNGFVIILNGLWIFIRKNIWESSQFNFLQESQPQLKFQIIFTSLHLCIFPSRLNVYSQGKNPTEYKPPYASPQKVALLSAFFQ
jgi:hypothetical protein